MMLVGRLNGDGLIGAAVPARVVRALTGVAAVVVAVALATGTTAAGTVMGIVGFAALGLGAACVVPTAVTAAAGARASGPGSSAFAVAVVVTGGYAGWLAGPAVVGGLAELTSLQLAVGILVVLLTLIAALAPVLASK